jgi:hypothetical protein
MEIGDKVEHIKHKHWGKGRIERFSKSGKSVEIRWIGVIGGSWWNRCKVENIRKIIET